MQATIWGWAERKSPVASDLDLQWLTSACEDTLSVAEQEAQQRRGQWFLPDQILVGLPASQLRGGAWPVTQRRSRPERRIEERELAALLDRALRLTYNRLAGQSDSSWVVVDAVPVSLTVDGHRVTDPVGFRGVEIGATVFAALARPEAIRTWQAVAQTLEFSTLTVTAAPLALARCMSGPQGILLDVGDTTTDLVWYRGGSPLALESLPVGGAELTTSLMRKWRLTSSRAKRLKQAYSGGRLDEDARDQVLAVLAPVLQSWLEKTEAALARLNVDALLPEHLYLLGGGSLLPEIADAARSLAWSQQLQFSRYPQVGRLQPTDVPGVVNRTELGRGAGDVPALALAAWTLQQIRTAPQPNRILAELCYG
jgi:cell division ATPase FtsA